MLLQTHIYFLKDTHAHAHTHTHTHTEGNWVLYKGDKEPDLDTVITFKMSSSELQCGQRRFAQTFRKVPNCTEFVAKDEIVDEVNHFMGRIIPGGMDKIHLGKIRIINSRTNNKKWLKMKNCFYNPVPNSLWRHKNGSWWTVSASDMDTVTLVAIKVFEPKKIQNKAAKINDIVYVSVFKTHICLLKHTFAF